MSLPDHGLPWKTFQGSADALKFARRDLATVARVIELCRQHRSCVQAGGNVGIFPAYLAKRFARIYTFEPSVTLFPLLYHNAPAGNIFRYQAALGCTRELVSTSQTRRGHKMDRRPHEGVTHIDGPGIVPTLQVDDLGLTDCDLLQLDVEGFEAFALDGARATIEKCRPVLMVEVNSNCTFYGYEPDDIRAQIARLGYRLEFREHSDDVYVPEEWTNEATNR